MGKGGQGESNGVLIEKKLKEFSWDTIKEKTSLQDKWLVIDGEVYNITQWAKRHPGGTRVISHYAGQDATDAFRAFHNNQDFAKKYMKAIHIGSVKDDQKCIKPIEEDFRELRATAEKMNLFKASSVFFTLSLIHILVLDWAAWAVMYYYGTGWIPFLLSLMLITTVEAQCSWLQHDFGHLAVFERTWLDHIFHYFVMGVMESQTGWLQHDFGHLSIFRSRPKLDHFFHYFTLGVIKAQVGWIQHDFGHLSVFRNNKRNHLLHYLTVGVLKGASPGWWNHMHYQHHAKPNVMDKDPDVRLEDLFVVGKNMPVEIAQKRKKSLPYNWQNYYFFLIGPPLLFPVYFQYMLFRFIFTRKAWMDLFVVTLFFMKFIYLFYPMLGLGWTLVYYFSFRCLESHWFTWVTQSNHIPMEIDHDKAQPWLKLQVHATCNVEKSFFNDWFTGHLNFQIEHHLFPTMPRHNLFRVAPLVKSLCEKHNIPYQVKPLSTAFADIVRSLKYSGELWEATYNAYHADGHQ